MNTIDLEHFSFDAPPRIPLPRAHVGDDYTQDRVAAPYRGVDYASEFLHYAWQDLDRVPALAAEYFSGAGNPHRIGTIYPGETVLDHACGAGLDLIIAAQRAGDTGKVIGIDRSSAMCEYARTAVELAGIAEIADIRTGTYEQLPVADGSVDVVISNAAINLAPDKQQVFRELHRVLRPGGRLFIADLVVPQRHGLLLLNTYGDPTFRAPDISSALPEQELLDLAAGAGFMNGRITEHFACFGGTQPDAQASILGANFFANKRFEIYS